MSRHVIIAPAHQSPNTLRLHIEDHVTIHLGQIEGPFIFSRFDTAAAHPRFYRYVYPPPSCWALIAKGTVLIDAFECPVLAPKVKTLLCPSTTSQPAHILSQDEIQSTDLAQSSDCSPAVAISSDASTPQVALSLSKLPSASQTHEVLGGGALYALIGARMWLASNELCTLVDRAPRGTDVLPELEEDLNQFGSGMWAWNEAEGTRMTRARIRYDGDIRMYVPLPGT